MKVIKITGKQGSGKSTRAEKLRKKLTNEGNKVVVIDDGCFYTDAAIKKINPDVLIIVSGE